MSFGKNTSKTRKQSHKPNPLHPLLTGSNSKC
jgi:hypothetical protein